MTKWTAHNTATGETSQHETVAAAKAALAEATRGDGSWRNEDGAWQKATADRELVAIVFRTADTAAIVEEFALCLDA